jgi:hypothetical protein
MRKKSILDFFFKLCYAEIRNKQRNSHIEPDSACDFAAETAGSWISNPKAKAEIQLYALWL